MSIYDVCHEAGGMSKYEWERDPKRLAFILARYKFVSKMLAGKHCVLEVGCADGFGSRLVAQTVKNLWAIDIDEKSIAEAKVNASLKWRINFIHQELKDCHSGFDAVYCLDVIEHIEPELSGDFLWKLHGTAPVCIIGTPSAESQQYASELSKQGHINCYSGQSLYSHCASKWSQVFMFGMNDEVLHTGFLPMSHYLFALCVK